MTSFPYRLQPLQATTGGLTALYSHSLASPNCRACQTTQSSMTANLSWQAANSQRWCRCSHSWSHCYNKTEKTATISSLVCLHNSHNFSTKSFVHYAYRLVISSLWTDVPVYSDFSSLHHLLCPYVYDWSVPTVWVNNCYTTEVSELKCFSEMCYFAILVQHPSGNGDEGDPRWISRLTTNWRVNDHEPSLCWWHHPVGHFGDRTTGVGGSPRPSQLQIQPTHQRRQEQGNGEQRHSVPHTHSEWTTGAGGYVPVPWAPDYRRWWDTMEFRTGQAIGASLQEIWKSQHTDLNDDMTNESASVGLWLPPFCKQNLLFI